jgi:4-amino-4-deoxy-L-arabinose transferase-like glycosyltransferase
VNGDSYAWIDSILNLINHGTYAAELDVFNTLFYRPPGFGFFIGGIYLLCGSDMAIALKVLPWVQIFLDTLCIWYIYKTTFSIFKRSRVALIASALYAFYPFVIVWTPLAVAESLSVFFLLGSLFFYFSEKKYGGLLAGVFLGLSVLTRLQVIFLFPFLAAGIYLSGTQLHKWKIKMIQFVLAFGFIYGMWPARNYFLHDRLLFSQDLNVGKNWSPDYLAFMDYIFAIQTDHLPQYDQIVNFEKVEWPHHAYLNEGDSALLASTVEMCRTCGTGFSWFMIHEGSRKEVVAKDQDCDEIIAANFKKLTAEQKSKNKMNYYLKVPASNLFKSFFKFNIYGDKSTAVKSLTSALFAYRTILLLSGLYALLLIYRRKAASYSFVFVALGFFSSWYLYLSFIYRNIEIRYLLPPDLILLPAAAFLIEYVYLKFIKKNKAEQV